VASTRWEIPWVGIVKKILLYYDELSFIPLNHHHRPLREGERETQRKEIAIKKCSSSGNNKENVRSVSRDRIDIVYI
jgi:hypothetical protein